MESRSRIPRTLRWFLAAVAFFSMTNLADGAPLQLMTAPNLLRVGATENIFVECQDYTGADIRVVINVLSHPTKAKRLVSTTVTLNNDNKFQTFGKILIPSADFSKDPKRKQYVYLQAQFPNRLLETVALVSFQSGYIFIQTDKTIYTPNTKVYYRMFAVTPLMEPVQTEENSQTEASIAIELVTPDGIILPFERASLTSGIHSGDYQIPEIASFGLWTLVAKFPNNPQQSFSAEFEVKEYVLPSFEVKLTAKHFFYVDSPDLAVNIKATYLFGEPVDGEAYVVFGFVDQEQKKSFPGSLQRTQVTRGESVVKLKREHITQTFNIQELVGKSIYVAVSVLTENGGEMVEAEMRGIQIVTSPYTIHFKKTPKYFKPGMSFNVAVEVLNPDESPANGIPVVVEPGNVQGFTAANGLAKLTINTRTGGNLEITAKTNDPGISLERQALARMTAQPYATTNSNYIHIGVDTAEVEVNDNLKISLTVSMPQNIDHDITYLILSRGQLISHGRYNRRGEVVISLIVPITKDMLPSFRIVAYYHTAANSMVSDSVWVDVKDSCMGSLTLEPTRAANSYEPRKMMGLKITGDPNAVVGLVAVDKGVFVLNNKHRLTQKKVWDTVEKYDTGCTPGGGRDNMGVFFDAGLIFQSSTAAGTPYRQELKCPAPSRRKRATTLLEVTTSLASQFEDKLIRSCCVDGMKDIPLSYDCDRRSEYITDGAACIAAFVKCCKALEGQRAGARHDKLMLARSEDDDDSFMDSNDIVSRTQFPESWLWTDVQLPPCPDNSQQCRTTTPVVKNAPLLDSITTWQFIGISLSPTRGICVAEPLEVIVRKDFFIDLRLPYSAVRGEQLEVKAILHNYNNDPITARVDLIEKPHVCSAASKRGRYRQEVRIGPMTTRSVSFVIIPMKDGQYEVEVKAAVKDSSMHDGIMKMLLVVPEGVLMKEPKTIILDPVKHGVDGTQEEIINNSIPKNNIVPNTPTSSQISITGQENIGPLVENAISGQSMGTLIYQPSGCGEQNMIHMTLPVIATTYLDKTNKWEEVGLQKRNEAIQHINHGYQNQLAYRRKDGSFSVWPERTGSTWLTAYVAKVFAMANNLVAVPNNMICDAVKFLILHTQRPDGVFHEVGRMSHGEMIGDVRGTDSDASMTAFCLIAMQEARTLCAATVNSLPGSIDKAVTYLETRLPTLTNPYAVAMTSYALANADKLNRNLLYRFVHPELNRWPTPKGHIYTLEATAYALLALVRAKAFEDAKPVVRWFNKQRKSGGGYGSTQATIMVYQAVAEYWANAQEPNYDLKVDVLLPGRARPDKYSFTRVNHYTTRTSKINDINQDVKVTATGTGEATLTLVSLYYAIPKEKESDCQRYSMTVELLPVKMDEDDKIYKLKIELLYKNPDHDATMTILDIGLLTGYTVNMDDLNALSKGPARSIARHEMDKVLSERGSLIIYLDKVSHTRPEEISFRLHQKLKVGILQPAAVSVYEYYDQTRCIKFYHPERRGGQLLKLCRNDECTCAEENCSMQRKGKIDNDDRTAKPCETTANSRIDYVYKVRQDEFTDGISTDFYSMKVEAVIKEGNADVAPLGKKRAFLGYPHCREPLALTTGKTYLVMGTSVDIYKDDQSQKIHYVLGERTWIEYWPTDAECQTDEYRNTCLGIQEMENQYRLFGCDQ
ncbi:complement C3-like [Genypterus blacodes]|uniref:complement C3-like n=1 Tax=Genypterus blacodes TaxID=154954 RepID=UPI003F768C32